MGAAVVILFALSLTHQVTPAAPPPDPTEVLENCLACHGDPALETTMPGGDVLKLFIDRAMFERSVHGKRGTCLDCHPGFSEMPHPALTARNRREFRAATYEACKRCHFDQYTHTLDSAHARALAKGDLNAPTCVDCHGSHDIQPAGEPRMRISQTCSPCHAGVMGGYASSVHGAALAADGNPDVPVCTDCHQSHAIAGSSDANWRARTPEICGRCHSDAATMAKYGLTTNVLTTYLTDFHGMTASLDATAADRGTVSALCTDCHGVHNIQKATGEGAAVMRANLTAKCRSCHPTAADDFPDAWLSHWEPSLTHAPLVYAVNVAYMILIPFIIGGLALQILLHVWRVVVNR